VLLSLAQNGKMLKVWGRFQEWVLHDPSRAARSYAEAIKRGISDNMLNLTSTSSTWLLPPNSVGSFHVQDPQWVDALQLRSLGVFGALHMCVCR
jgi:hypothetical protein